MRQLLYISSARHFTPADEIGRILITSRRNNQRDRLSGLLWSDGSRFLQVLEGDPTTVGITLERIRLDDRHRAIVILHDREIAKATFGAWSMAHIGDGEARIAAALETADPVVRGTFEGLINTRRAA